MGDGPVDDQRRHGLAGRGPLLGDLPDLLHVSRHGREPDQIPLQALRSVRPLHGPEIGQQLARAEQMHDRVETVQAVLQSGELAAADRLHHAEGGSGVLVEPASIEPLERIQRPRMNLLASCSTFGTGIGEPVVEPLVADHGSQERLEAEQVFPEPVGELTGAFVVVFHGVLL